MSDTVLSPSTDPALSLDGDVPRLGEAAPTLPAAVPEMAVPATPAEPVLADVAPTLPTVAPALPAPAPTAPAEAPALPVVSPVLTSDEAPTLPTANPQATPIEVPDPAASDDDDEDGHPMAHLMPNRSKATEASLRAAEIRAAQKAKSKKIKIGIAVGSLVFAALVGPPVFKWTADAVNEAGNTTTEDVAD